MWPNHFHGRYETDWLTLCLIANRVSTLYVVFVKTYACLLSVVAFLGSLHISKKTSQKRIIFNNIM